MRVIKLVVLVLISIMFAGILVGCQEKEEKVREFMKLRYANESIGRIYKKSGLQVPSLELKDLDFKVNSLKVVRIATEDAKETKFHFVRAKIIYDLRFNLRGTDAKFIAVRWGQFKLEEDGFGNLIVDENKSNEVFAFGENEQEMKHLFPERVEKGESLLK